MSAPSAKLGGSFLGGVTKPTGALGFGRSSTGVGQAASNGELGVSAGGKIGAAITGGDSASSFGSTVGGVSSGFGGLTADVKLSPPDVSAGRLTVTSGVDIQRQGEKFSA